MARIWVVLAFAVVAIGAAAWPIFPADGDLFYHLASGRWIAEHHTLPATAFFSVLPAAAGWADYYWLFQLLVFALHSLAGWVALVVLRAALLLALLGVLLAHLRRSGGRIGVWQATVWTLVLLVVLPRFASLRPHLFSLLLLAAFLFVLEHVPRALPALPVLAILWVNLHGIEYPVLLLVLGAFAAPLVLDLLRPRRVPIGDERRRLTWIALASLAPLVTPHGLRLLPLPFASVEFVRRAIAEMRPFDFSRLELQLVRGGITAESALAVLLLFALAALVHRASRRTLPLPHLLLAAGGALLLLRGARFVLEFALLVVPLLASWRPRPPALPVAVRRLAAAALALAALLGIPNQLVTHRRWPLDEAALPSGVSRFLARAGDGGVVLGYPDLAGWFEWTLFPRYRVFADLQAYLFDERSLFTTSAAFTDRQVLAGVLARWRPQWVAAPITSPRFRPLLDSVGGYAPVAFDSTMVLFARRAAQEALVDRFELRAVDPYAALQPLPSPRREHAARELARLLALDADNGAVAAALARVRLSQGAKRDALQLATRATELAPARPEPWQLRGEAFAAAGRYEEALADYRRAAARNASPAAIGRLVWAAETRLGHSTRAYRALAPVAVPLAGDTSWTDLWGLAESARARGDLDEAERLLLFAWWKAPDGAARERLATALGELRNPTRANHDH